MLKGLPLRELVETFFESVAGGGVGGANGGASAPHAELTALAVRHVPDLLHAFSEVCEKSLWGISFVFCLFQALSAGLEHPSKEYCFRPNSRCRRGTGAS